MNQRIKGLIWGVGILSSYSVLGLTVAGSELIRDKTIKELLIRNGYSILDTEGDSDNIIWSEILKVRELPSSLNKVSANNQENIKSMCKSLLRKTSKENYEQAKLYCVRSRDYSNS